MPKTLNFDPDGVAMTVTTQAPQMGVDGGVFIPFQVTAGSLTFNGRTEIDIDQFATGAALDQGIQADMLAWCTQMSPYVLLMQALATIGY